MRYADFVRTLSAPRLDRYLEACAGDTRRAMTLYRLNLRLTQELHTVVSCFEVALRNALDAHYVSRHGADWLRAAVAPGGVYTDPACRQAAAIIWEALRKLGARYSHGKLVAELTFGFWRYQFARPQFRAGGQTLVAIFSAKPRSTPTTNYGQAYFFTELEEVNRLRNRIAHHEPVCFVPTEARVSTAYVRNQYARMLRLFQWLEINERELLYGLDHIETVCAAIDRLGAASSTGRTAASASR